MFLSGNCIWRLWYGCRHGGCYRRFGWDGWVP